MRCTINLHGPRGYIQTNVSHSVNPNSFSLYHFWGEGRGGVGGGGGGGGIPRDFCFQSNFFPLAFPANRIWSGGGVRIDGYRGYRLCP